MPSFFPEGNTALASDDEKRSLIKITDLLAGGSGSSASSGSGPPDGSTTGLIYIDNTAKVVYFYTGGDWYGALSLT